MGTIWSWWFSHAKTRFSLNFYNSTQRLKLKVVFHENHGNSWLKPSTSFASHFTNTLRILKSFGVLKRAGSEVLIFEVFKIICKIFAMPPCNSIMKQNNQHFAIDSRGGGPRASAHTAIRASHHRQIEEEHPLNNLPHFGAIPFIKKMSVHAHFGLPFPLGFPSGRT